MRLALNTIGCLAGAISISASPDLEVLRSFQNQIAAIQRDAVWWLHTVVPSISKLAPKDYVHWYDQLCPAGASLSETRGASGQQPTPRDVRASGRASGRRGPVWLGWGAPCWEGPGACQPLQAPLKSQEAGHPSAHRLPRPWGLMRWRGPGPLPDGPAALQPP